MNISTPGWGTQRQLLDVLAIYRNPVPMEAAAAQGIDMDDDDRTKLEDLSLLECIDSEEEDLYYVHRLTARRLLDQMQPGDRNTYHQEAAQYFVALRDEEGNKYLENEIEARWHYLQAGQWNEAAAITFALEDYLSLRGYPQWAMELLQELKLEEMGEEHRGVAHNRLGLLYQNFGEYDKALEHYEESLKIDEKRKDSKGIAINLHQIGIIYQEKGDYDAALTQYKKAREVFEKIGDINGAAISLAQIGDIYFQKEKYEEALSLWLQAFLVFYKIGSPNAKAAKTNIGIVRQKLPQDRFHAILTEYNLEPGLFDTPEETDQN